MKTIKIRFVGGPLHNELKTVERRGYIDIVVGKPLELCAKWAGPPPVVEQTWHKETYRLMRFFSEYKTIFEQYVHESLCHGLEPAPETYSERLPTIEFDPSALVRLCNRLRKP